MLFATGGIAELRRASDNASFYTDAISGDEHDWIDDLAERVVWPGANVPSVCVLDTGVNRGHALLEPALAEQDMHTLDRRWGKDDKESGHGTGMAGLALHGDLTASLGDTEVRRLRHRLESLNFSRRTSLMRMTRAAMAYSRRPPWRSPRSRLPSAGAYFVWPSLMKT
ncbi:S8 family serine peptidase [Bradyrhizobium sp. Lot11]